MRDYIMMYRWPREQCMQLLVNANAFSPACAHCTKLLTQQQTTTITLPRNLFSCVYATSSNSHIMLSTTSLTALNIVAYVGNTLITYGVGTGVFSKLPTNAQLSSKYQTLITPVGWAFAFWGIIFTTQLVWVLFARRQAAAVQTVGLNYVGVCAAQIVWTLAFALEFMALSMAAMLVILFLLMRIVNALDPIELNYFYKFPFSIHASWIAAASVVNANLLLVFYNVAPSVQFLVGVLSLVGLFVIAISWIRQSNDAIPPLVIVWALIGIAFELKSPQASITTAFGAQQIAIIQYMAIVGSIVLGICVILKQFFGFIRGKDNTTKDDSLLKAAH
jgi:hypothetical protein